MGNNLRILHDHMGRPPHGLRIQGTSETTGFEMRNLEDGVRHRFWQATSTASQRLFYDSGLGNTVSVDYVTIARADLLVAAGVTLDLQWSADGATGWTSFGGSFPLALGSGNLIAPTSQDAVFEFSTQTRRAVGIFLSGATTAPIFAGLQMGARTEVTNNPMYGRQYTVSRAHFGAIWAAQWAPQSDAATTALLATLAAITPTFPLEIVQESTVGHPYGAMAHYLYDPTGALFRSSVPILIPVVCRTGMSASARALAPGLDAPDAVVEWQQVI